MRDKTEYYVNLIVVIFLAVIGTYIMGKCSPLSYSFPNDQYERLAPSLAQGHLYLDMEVDPRFETMNNPYDYAEREAVLGGHGYYDSAYYIGHYYLYFGVVPEIMVFLPYYLISGGESLSTYHVAQIYYVFALAGLFLLLGAIRKIKFPTLGFSYYLMLCVSFSAICFWNIIGAPTMYGIAIISGVCFAIWSLFLFFVADNTDNCFGKRRVILIVLGSLCGALTFGCRPVIGMANFAILPFAYNIYKNRRAREIIGLVLPYVLVAIALMLYNYFRFDNFFEFGHSYQLTEGDYTNGGKGFGLPHIVKIMYRSLFKINGIYRTPPFIHFDGIFFEFPILLSFLLLIREATIKKVIEKKLLGWMFFLAIAVGAVLTMTGRYVAYTFERYKMDFSFLICIGCFIIIAATMEMATDYQSKIYKVTIPGFTMITLLTAFLLFCIPDDINFAFFYPDIINKIFSAFRL